MAPLPSCVVTQGISVASTKRSSAALAACAPLDASTTARRSPIAASAASIARGDGCGRAGDSGLTGCASVRARATSWGNTRCTGPGLPSIASVHAAASSAGTDDARRIRRERLVTGANSAVSGRYWKSPSGSPSSGRCALIAIIGQRPRCACATPVIRLVAPGPRVEKQTPGLPVSRPSVAARNAATCSCRVTTTSTPAAESASVRASVCSPGTP